MSDSATLTAGEPVRQFSVFIENRAGRLHDLTALLAAHQVHVLAMTTLDTTDCAINRIIVDDPDRARELMAANNFAFTECDVLVVEFNDESHLPAVLRGLADAEINIHYLYAFLTRPRDRCALACNVEDLDLANQALNHRGFKTLMQRDVSR